MSEPQHDWFFVDSAGQQNGPHTRDELIARWRAGDVRGTSLVWAPTLPDWISFAQAFPALTPPAAPPVAPRPPPTPSAPVAQDRINAPSLGTPVPELPTAWTVPAPAAPRDEAGARLSPGVHPWRRYFAKQLDVMVFSVGSVFAFAVALEFISPETGAGFSQAMDNQFAAALVAVALWGIGDALCLAWFGNTPGRSLYGIRVSMADGSRLTAATAFMRSTLVGIKGMGFGIPIVALVTTLVAYNKLTRDGASSWDSELGTQVTHIPWSVARGLVVVTITLVALFALLVLIAMAQ